MSSPTTSRPLAPTLAAELALSRPRSVCIVMLSALGDAVHVLPVATAIKRHWPQTRISWIVQRLPWRLLRGHPAIDEFIVFERRPGLSGIDGFIDLRERIKGRSFDLLLGLQTYLKAGVIAGFVPARVKLGFDRSRARDLQWLFTNRRIPARPSAHVQDQYFEFLHSLGIDERPVRWGLSFTDEERERQARFLARAEAPLGALVLATSDPRKDWTIDGYVAVADWMERRHGLRPVLVGGPSPRERAVADQLLARSKARPLDALGNDPRRLAWMLDASALVVSPDTGPLHLGRALGTPVVGLFGHTNPKRSGPYRAFEDLLVDGYAEYPGEPYGPESGRRRHGMRRVTVERVLAKIDLAVQRYVASR